MTKRIIKTTLFGAVISVATIKILMIAVGSTIFDSILRVLSPFGVEFNAMEFGQIIFVAIITAIMAHLIYTNKIKLPKFLSKYLG